jgi:methylated-DNA-[protein]-cysteine S-methyltransferase
MRALDFDDYISRMHRLLREHYGDYTLENGPPPIDVVRALGAYFAGDLTALDKIRTETGGTPFQRAVWRALRSIKPGTASRAVGAANGANPIAIIVPCHRVIGANRTLTGHAGGLSRKQWLLEHESAHAPARRSEAKVAACSS